MLGTDPAAWRCYEDPCWTTCWPASRSADIALPVPASLATFR